MIATGETTDMDTATIKALNEAHVINTYGARKLAIVRGEDCRLWNAEGNEYLDCFAGIAVCNLGHCHPAVTQAITDQAQTLVHVSNLYYIEPQVKLAQLLCEKSFANQWFFANCGATANEAAIKLARRYWAQKGTPKPHIITAESSFHGRTMATITATGQPKFHEGFDPMLPGFSYVPYGDAEAIANAITPETGAVMIEPVQGEGGVRIPPAGYLQKVRAICDEKNLLLIFDEVQTGMGRTGTLFAYEHSGITPDIITLSKALGNGIPIGAMGCTDDAATGFSVGSHATTFGGNPLCSAAALATLQTITSPGFLENASETGIYFRSKLEAIAAKHDIVDEVRGIGLMIGVACNVPVAPIVQGMIDRGVICGPAGANVLRFVPPLTITPADVDKAVATLDDVLGSVAK